MGQVKGQGLDTQRNPCGEAEVMGVGLNHRESGQHGNETIKQHRLFVFVLIRFSVGNSWA